MNVIDYSCFFAATESLKVTYPKLKKKESYTSEVWR